MNLFDSLPIEALLPVFLNSPPMTTPVLAQVCKQWAVVCNSDELWKRYSQSLSDYPIPRDTDLKSNSLLPMKVNAAGTTTIAWRDLYFLRYMISDIAIDQTHLLLFANSARLNALIIKRQLEVPAIAKVIGASEKTKKKRNLKFKKQAPASFAGLPLDLTEENYVPYFHQLIDIITKAGARQEEAYHPVMISAFGMISTLFMHLNKYTLTIKPKVLAAFAEAWKGGQEFTQCGFEIGSALASRANEHSRTLVFKQFTRCLVYSRKNGFPEMGILSNYALKDIIAESNLVAKLPPQLLVDWLSNMLLSAAPGIPDELDKAPEVIPDRILDLEEFLTLTVQAIRSQPAKIVLAAIKQVSVETWKQRFVRAFFLKLLRSTTPYAVEQVQNELITHFALPSLSDPSTGVRIAICRTLGELASEGTLNFEADTPILKPLLSIAIKGENEMERTSGWLALTENIERGDGSESWSQTIGALLPTIAAQLFDKNGSKSMLGCVTCCLASAFECAGDSLHTHVDELAKALLQTGLGLVSDLEDPDSEDVAAQCVQALGTLFKSVGTEKAQPHLPATRDLFKKLSMEMGPDNHFVQRAYMMLAAVDSSPDTMQRAMASATAAFTQTALAIVEGNDDQGEEDDEEEEDDPFDMGEEEGQVMNLNTSIVEQQRAILLLIQDLVETDPKLGIPYVETINLAYTAIWTLPYMGATALESIYELAFRTMLRFASLATYATQNEATLPADRVAACKALPKMFFDKVIEKLSEDASPEFKAAAATALTDLWPELPTPPPQTVVIDIIARLATAVADYDNQLVADEQTQFYELDPNYSELSGSAYLFISCTNTPFAEFVYKTPLALMLQNLGGTISYHFVYGIIGQAMSDPVCQDLVAKSIHQHLAALKNTNPNVPLQNVVFAMAQVACHAPSIVQPHASTLMQSFIDILSLPSTFPNLDAVRDNVIAGIGWLLLKLPDHFTAALPLTKLAFESWFGGIPFTADLEEMESIAQQMAGFLQQYANILPLKLPRLANNTSRNRQEVLLSSQLLAKVSTILESVSGPFHKDYLKQWLASKQI